MATQPKSGQRGGDAKIETEKHHRNRAKRALKKADRFWRLAETATSGSFRELRMTQAKEQSALAAEATGQADEMRQKTPEKME